MRIETVSRHHRPIPLVPVPTQVKLAASLEEEYHMAPNKGEFLMKRQLDLLVASRRFVDNVRPGFLANPATDRPLEYDRHYLEGVAFEFNGRQHLAAAAQNGAEDKAAQDLRMRDLLKAALSKEAGVELVVVTAQDLRPGELSKLIPAMLKRNYIDVNGPYCRTLFRISAAYAAHAAKAARSAK